VLAHGEKGNCVGVCGAGKVGLVGGKSLSGISSMPPLDVAYCLARCAAPASGQPSLFTSAQADTANSPDAADQGACNGHSL